MILHKKKDTLNRSCCIMKVTKQTLQHLRKKVPLANTIHHSIFLYNQFKKLNLCKSFSNRVIGHLMSILISIFISGYHGKTTDFSQNSSCPRTTIAHFLNSGKWDDTLLENTLKSSVVEIIYSEAQRTGKPVFCIVDDTIASKTKPSSQALHPIEDAYFLCDCGYVSEKIINTFVQKGFHTIGALKTNRLLYPSGMKKKLSELAAELSVTEKGFDLVTVKNRKYYVYRYEENLNGIENAVVLLSYPEKAFGNPKALRAFISTNVALSTLKILSCYVCRWPIEVFFRQCKTRLALDTYQIRSSKGIQRYWLLMSMAHYITILYDKYIPFRLFFHLGKLFCLLYPEDVLFDFLILFFISDCTAGHQCTYCSCCIMCYFFVEMIGSVDSVAPVFL